MTGWRPPNMKSVTWLWDGKNGRGCSARFVTCSMWKLKLKKLVPNIGYWQLERKQRRAASFINRDCKFWYRGCTYYQIFVLPRYWHDSVPLSHIREGDQELNCQQIQSLYKLNTFAINIRYKLNDIKTIWKGEPKLKTMNWIIPSVM